MAGLSVESIMSAADKVIALAGNAAQIITENAAKAANIQGVREATAALNIDDEVAVGTQKAAAELNSIQNARKAASAFAVNMDDANEMVTTLGKRYAESAQKAVAIAEDITKRSSVMPWDDFLGFIGNQLVIPFRANELQAHTASAKLAAAALKEANEAVQSQAVTENTIKQTLTTETQKALQRTLRFTAEDKLAQLQLQGITLNSGNVKAVFEMNTTQLDTYLKVTQLFNSQAHLELAKQNFRLNEEKWKQELSEKLEIKESEEDIALTVNTGRAAQNLPPLPSKQIKQQLKMGGEVSKVLQDNYITGASIRTSGTPTLGGSPAKAAETIVRSQAPLTPEQQGVKKFLIEAVTAGAATIPPNIDPKANPAGAADYVNQTVITAAASQAKNIKTGDASNIYAISSLKPIMESAVLRDSPIYNVVLKPLMDTGYDKVDPEDLVSKTMAAVVQKQIPYQEAVNGLAVIFRVGAAINNETRRYQMFGLPNQSNYNTKFTTTFGTVAGGGGSATYSIDMTDPTKISVLMSRKLAEQTGQDVKSSRGSSGSF